jgi:lysozyme
MMPLPSKRGLAAIIGSIAAAGVLALTPAFEGTVLTTYRDQGGVLTYCTGATEDAQWGRTYTPEQCKAQLDSDLARHAEGMMECIHVPMADGQKIAYTDVTYNIGVAAFCGSSMARRTNAGDAAGGCEALLMWDKIGGTAVRGLTRRRAADREICLRGLN